MQLAQWHHLKDHHNAPPLFCIDDFGVHLDRVRRDALLGRSIIHNDLLLNIYLLNLA